MITLGFLLVAALPVFAIVNPRGSDATHDILTWNWEHFPLNGNLTVNTLTVMIQDLDVDLIVVQEIESMDDFDQLVSQMNDWDGIYSPDDYFPDSYMKTGILWHEDRVEVGEMNQLFLGEGLTRPPITVPVTMFENGDTLSFNLITFHLKAGTQGSDLTQRRHANELMHDYVLEQIDAGETKWMMAGDWNDELDDSNNLNAFTIFLDEPDDWIWLTEDMVGIYARASHINSGRLIDHFLITPDLYAEYNEEPGGDTEAVRLDDELGTYQDNISDHRPVGTYFPGTINVVDEPVATSNLPISHDLIQAWPNPFNSQIRIKIGESVKGTRADVYNLQGRIIASFDLPNSESETQFLWDAGQLPAGTYFLRIGDGKQQLVKKVILLK